MIKKNTKAIFIDGDNQHEEDLAGGIPLTKGEILTIHKNDEVSVYSVVDKKTECFMGGDDQIVNIVYTLKKQ
ncbi:MAG: hypothetical protein WCX97_03485 [Candidatus Magasanikbacteria bacterium]